MSEEQFSVGSKNVWHLNCKGKPVMTNMSLISRDYCNDIYVYHCGFCERDFDFSGYRLTAQLSEGK